VVAQSVEHEACFVFTGSTEAMFSKTRARVAYGSNVLREQCPCISLIAHQDNSRPQTKVTHGEFFGSPLSHRTAPSNIPGCVLLK
jgi:hypothetical protein